MPYDISEIASIAPFRLDIDLQLLYAIACDEPSKIKTRYAPCRFHFVSSHPIYPCGMTWTRAQQHNPM